MSDDKKKKLFDYIEQSKKGTFDDYNNKIYSFIKILILKTQICIQKVF